MKLSIVATLYRSAEYIEEFYQRSKKVAQEFAGEDYEILLVNDGSPDNSLELAIELTERDDKVVLVDLSRNFGHHKAMMTGLEQAQGELVYLLDSDLEEEPEWLTGFAEKMQGSNCDVVYGVQEERKGGLIERLTGNLFYKLLNRLTRLNLPKNLVTARLMTRRYVNALIQHREREVFMAGLWHATGFDQVAFPLKKHSTSETTYTLKRKLSILVNSVTSFSNLPLILSFYTGMVISFFSACYIAYLLIRWYFFAKPLGGWTSVIASIWLVGGMNIFFIGVTGIYLSKIFAETKQRPYSIIRHIYGKQRN